MRTIFRRCLKSVAVLAALLVVSAAAACSVPVFRYALEHWRPDPYEVLVYHHEALSEEQEALLKLLAPEYVPGEPLPNAAVSQIDLNGKVRPEFAAIWSEAPSETLPWLIVRTPWKGENETVWQGPLTAESMATILRSPLRSELVKRLAEGESVVWVLLEGPDAAANDRLVMQLTDQLTDLQGGIQLPEIQAEDLNSLSVNPDQLGLRFSVLRMRRDDTRENLLLKTLLTVQPGLDAAELSAEPMLFPVFGRGRVYFPLVGSAIEPANVEDLARFLSGACQCTIKQQNPGVDLLTTVDWDAYVLGIETEKPLPPLTGLGGFAVAETPANVEPRSDPDDASSAETRTSQPGANSAAKHEAAIATVAPALPTPSLDPAALAPAASEAGDSSAALSSQVVRMLGLLAAVVVIVSLVQVFRRPA